MDRMVQPLMLLWPVISLLFMNELQQRGLGGPGETQSLKILISDVQVRKIGFISSGGWGTQELFFSAMSEGIPRIQASGRSLLTAEPVGHT